MSGAPVSSCTSAYTDVCAEGPARPGPLQRAATRPGAEQAARAQPAPPSPGAGAGLAGRCAPPNAGAASLGAGSASAQAFQAGVLAAAGTAGVLAAAPAADATPAGPLARSAAPAAGSPGAQATAPAASVPGEPGAVRRIASPTREHLCAALAAQQGLTPFRVDLLVTELERFLALKAMHQDWQATVLSPSGAALPPPARVPRRTTAPHLQLHLNPAGLPGPPTRTSFDP